jgi:uncharacterized protein YndB with AHSA1/START domain
MILAYANKDEGMTANTLSVSLPSPTELVLTRQFDAPRDLVWRAFTERDLVAQWWGQRNSTTIIDKLEARPGGGWRFRQQMEDGTEHAFRGEFLEIQPPERIVWTFEYEPMAGHIVTDAVTFTEPEPGKTLITVLSTFASQEDRDGMLQSGMEAGAAESYDRLEELLATLR